MNLDLTNDQQLIKSSAREFLQAESSSDIVREIEESESGHSEELWKKMAKLGWMGLIIPEKYGGVGVTSLDFFDLILILEEMGYHLTLNGFFSTVVLGVIPILEAGTEAQKNFFLPRLAEGEIKFSLALMEPSATFDPSGIETKAISRSDGYTINGVKLFIEDAQIADYFICAARTAPGSSSEGITLFIVDAKSSGITITPLPTIGLERQFEVKFEGVTAPAESILGEIGKGWDVMKSVLEKAAVAKSAEMLGGMQACLDITNRFVKERVQYDHPIGSYQVIQHYLANVWVDIVSSKEVVYKAASLINAGVPCNREASIAKAWLGKTFFRTAERCVQMHGALGVTREQNIGLYYRQAMAWNLALGSSYEHLSRIAEGFKQALEGGVFCLDANMGIVEKNKVVAK